MIALRLKHVLSTAVVFTLLAGASACGDNPLNPSDFGIEATDLVVGSGTEAETYRGATVDYTLWLYDPTQPEGKGQLIQSADQPFSFAVGYGQVIAGWDLGVPGMRVGGIRRLVIPPEYAYGSAGSTTVPPNATLLFEIELIGVY